MSVSGDGRYWWRRDWSVLILIRGLPSVSHRRHPHCSWWVSRIINSTINHATTKLTCSNEISIFITRGPPSSSAFGEQWEHLLRPARILFPICNASLIKQRHLLTGNAQCGAIGPGCLMRRVLSPKSKLGNSKVNAHYQKLQAVCEEHSLAKAH